MDINPEILEKRYESLPGAIKQLMDSTEVATKISSIGDKYGLSEEQTEEVANQMSLIMLGFVQPKELLNNLRTEVRVLGSSSADIDQELKEIIAPIKEVLEKTYGWAPEEIANKEMAPKETLTKIEVPPAGTSIAEMAKLFAAEEIAKRKQAIK